MNILKSMSVALFLLSALFQSHLSALTIDPSQGAAEGDLIFYDAKLLPIEGKGWTDTEDYYDRLPARAKNGVRKEVWDLSKRTSGMLYRFSTDAKQLTIRWMLTSKRDRQLGNDIMAPIAMSGLDLYGLDPAGNWRFIPLKINPRNKLNEKLVKLNSGNFSEYMLYLPLNNGIESLSLGIAANAKLEVNEKERPLVVIYGTSIVQGASASRPGMTFTAIVGRRLDIEIINLGFNGNAKLEPEMAQLVSELQPDAFIIDPLRNNQAKELMEAFEPFVRTILAAHPDVPMLFADEAQYNDIGPIKDSRIVMEVHSKLQAEGYTNVSFLPNRGMLGGDYEGTVDGTHPSDLGMMRMAEVFTPAVAELLGLEVQ